MPVTRNPLTERLKSFFGRGDAILREALRALSAEEMASVIDGLNSREQQQVISLISEEKLADAIGHLGPHSSKNIIPKLSHEKVLRLIGHLESDDIADLIQQLDDKKKERVITALRKSDPKKVLPLLGFEEDSAGGLMKSEVLKGEREQTVEEARGILAGSRIQDATSVFVTDHDGRLVGAVSLIRVASAKPGMKLGDIMKRDPLYVPVTMPQEDVVNFFEEQDVLEAPVIDARGRLLGVITADDILDVLEEEFSEDLSRLVGVSGDERITDPAMVAVKLRLPWLIVNLFTASFAAWVVTNFESTIARLAVLAALMPVVAGLGGNSASQSLGVSLRALALGELHSWSTWRVLWRQVILGLTNGLILGSIMASLVVWWTGNGILAFVVLGAMLANILLGSLIGFAVPAALHRMKVDPALASAVFLTATTDAAGFFAFLGLASIFL